MYKVEIQHIGGRIDTVAAVERIEFTDDGNWVKLIRNGKDALLVNVRTVEAIAIPPNLM